MSASNLVADQVWKQIESTQTVNDDQLYILHFLFGKNFEGATRIVDQRGVKKISGDPSGRFIFQVFLLHHSFFAFTFVFVYLFIVFFIQHIWGPFQLNSLKLGYISYDFNLYTHFLKYLPQCSTDSLD